MGVRSSVWCHHDDVVIPCRGWVERDLGPYHLDDEPFRREIVEDRQGTPLRLVIRLVLADASTPADGAVVDVWQCDALGRYSAFGDAPAKAGEAPPAAAPDETFLRGRQVADEQGMCVFDTIYPGWYGGRTVHIHVLASHSDRRYVSQFFFPEDITDQVHARPPYDERPDRDTRNQTDDIFADDGAATILDLTPAAAGYEGAICLVLAHG